MEYTLVTEEPDIIGQQCQEFYLLQHQINGQMSSSANVAYFKFENCWIRLYFEPLMIFWDDDQAPMEPINSDLESMLVLVNLNEINGVIGCVLKSIEYGVKDNNVFFLWLFMVESVCFFHMIHRQI